MRAISNLEDDWEEDKMVGGVNELFIEYVLSRRLIFIEVIKIVMGWTKAHLHGFRRGSLICL